jgi:hypothetical protein
MHKRRQDERETFPFSRGTGRRREEMTNDKQIMRDKVEAVLPGSEERTEVPAR